MKNNALPPPTPAALPKVPPRNPMAEHRSICILDATTFAIPGIDYE
jgi:hypothetical protein